MRRSISVALASMALTVSLALAGCGQKGDLTLPPAAAPAASGASS